MDEKLIKLISEDSSLCDHWAGGLCYKPEGWRNKKLSKEEEKKLPDCKCKPGEKGILCNDCRPDSVLLDSRPSLFDVSGTDST